MGENAVSDPATNERVRCIEQLLHSKRYSVYLGVNSSKRVQRLSEPSALFKTRRPVAGRLIKLEIAESGHPPRIFQDVDVTPQDVHREPV